MRKPTEPGGWQSAPGSVEAPLDPDDVPTRPDNTDPSTLALVRLFGDLSMPDRARAVSLLQNWSNCTLDRRVLIEAFSRELGT